MIALPQTRHITREAQLLINLLANVQRCMTHEEACRTADLTETACNAAPAKRMNAHGQAGLTMPATMAPSRVSGFTYIRHNSKRLALDKTSVMLTTCKGGVAHS